MQETLQALLGLQELDQDIFRAGREVKRLPEERARRRSGIDAKISERDDFDHKLAQVKAQLKEIEDHTTIQRQRLRKLEVEMNKARADAAMVAAFQHEMRSLKRDISEAEEEGLRFVDQSDGLQKLRDVLNSEIEALEAEFQEYNGNVEVELSAAQKEYDELNVRRRERMSGSIPPDVLTRYEQLLEAREGVAMALLEDRICQGCYMAVPTNIYVRVARGTEVVACPNCDRILHLSDD